MIETSYNFALVGLSYAVAVYGSYTALNLAMRIPLAESGKVFWWLTGASVALGGGAIWCMHFIGMLAYNMQMDYNFDVGLTLASFLIAVLLVAAGLFIVGRGGSSLIKLVIAGIIAGMGVVAMHYTGMAAMIMPADIVYDMNIVWLSVAIAITASIVALWLAFNLRGKLQQFGSAFVMGVAVCGMHYTAMSAASIVPNNVDVEITKSFLSAQTLGIMFFAAAVLILTVFLVAHTLNPNKVEEDYLA